MMASSHHGGVGGKFSIGYKTEKEPSKGDDRPIHLPESRGSTRDNIAYLQHSELFTLHT